jgi:hypothetical protein
MNISRYYDIISCTLIEMFQGSPKKRSFYEIFKEKRSF